MVSLVDGFSDGTSSLLEGFSISAPTVFDASSLEIEHAALSVPDSSLLATV